MRALRIVVIALLALSASAPALAQSSAAPVAVLVQSAGEVQIRRGSTTLLPGVVGTPLMVGDQLIIGAGARATVLHRTGLVEVIKHTDHIQASGTTPSPAFAQTMETLTQIATTDARSQPNRQGMIRPAPGTAVPVSPRNGIKVLDATPEFVWLSIPGTSSYSIQLRGIGSTHQRFVTGSDTVWTLPDSLALTHGGEYEWTAGRTVDGRTAPLQRFRTATDAERRAIESVFDEIRSWGLDPDEDGLFMAALAYRNAGFLYDAVATLERLEAREGNHGSAFHLLRAELFDALGRLDEAAREFELADAAVGS